MQLSNVETQVRWDTKTDSTTFTDADILREANNEYAKLIMEKCQMEGNTSSLANFVTTTLKAQSGLSAGDTGYNGEYPFPDDCLYITRIEVKFDDDHIPVVLYDASENSYSEYSDVDEPFDEGEPKVRLQRDSIFVRPFPDSDVSAGIYIEYVQRQTAFSDDADEAEFENNFHDLIPMGVAIRFFKRDAKKYGSELLEMRRDYNEMKQEFLEFYRDRNEKRLKISTKKETF
jgi:hypothetical protein